MYKFEFPKSNLSDILGWEPTLLSGAANFLADCHAQFLKTISALFYLAGSASAAERKLSTSTAERNTRGTASSAKRKCMLCFGTNPLFVFVFHLHIFPPSFDIRIETGCKLAPLCFLGTQSGLSGGGGSGIREPL